jgi:hypothetical protein
MESPRSGTLSRGQVIFLAKPVSTAIVKVTSTSDVLLSLETLLWIFPKVEDEV